MTAYHWTPPGNYFADYLIADEDNMVIAFVPPKTGGEPVARLFAAAPQLLEALRAMCALYELWDTTPIGDFIDEYNKAQAAISAAEGAP